MSGIESNKMPPSPVLDSIDYSLSSLKSVDRNNDFLSCRKSQDFDSTEALFHQTRNTTNTTHPNDLTSFQRYLWSMACRKSQDFDSHETLGHQTRNTTKKTHPNDFKSFPYFLSSIACRKSQDFDSTEIPSSRDHIQSLHYPNGAIGHISRSADSVHSLSIADDSLVVKIPLDGSEASNVQDELVTNNPAPKTLQLPSFLPARPVQVICSFSEAALQKVAQPSTTTANKGRRVYKPRRVVPDVKVYVEAYKDEDVISGRSTRTNTHSGNCSYRDLVKEESKDYRQSSDKDKRGIVAKIIKTIHGRNGLFLKMERETKRWYLSHEKVAYTKVAQALRDHNHEEPRAVKRAKHVLNRKT
jgi:hypothetical protein